MHRYDIRGSWGLAAVTALALLCVLSATASAADDASLRFEGRVLWIAGTTLMIATDSQSINVDLTYVPQDEYLERDDRVVVTGIIPTERNRIVATSIEQLEPSDGGSIFSPY